jgi:hypothetical protein
MTYDIDLRINSEETLFMFGQCVFLYYSGFIAFAHSFSAHTV